MIFFLIDFSSIFNRFWGASWSKNRSKIDLNANMSKLQKLSSRVHESSIFRDLMGEKPFSFLQKVIKKSIKKVIDFLIDFCSIFNRFYAPSWGQVGPKID